MKLYSAIIIVSMALFVASAPTFTSLTHYWNPNNASFNLSPLLPEQPQGPIIELSSKPNLDMMLYQHNVYGLENLNQFK